jgi:hypothetical protein
MQILPPNFLFRNTRVGLRTLPQSYGKFEQYLPIFESRHPRQQLDSHSIGTPPSFATPIIILGPTESDPTMGEGGL